jgi:hypothetical protein
MTDQGEQLDRWFEEHERIRRWYVRTSRAMTRKLARIRNGECVYRVRAKPPRKR